jgi:hypothetical protein
MKIKWFIARFHDIEIGETIMQMEHKLLTLCLGNVLS